MSRTRIALLASLVLVFFCILTSCSKVERSISDTRAQAYVRTDSVMGLSLYVLPDSNSSRRGSDSSIQFVVKSPDGNLSWGFKALRVSYDGQLYYGSSDICMPLGLNLPEGLWSADVSFSDGSTVKLEFVISYTDKDSALKAFSESGSEGPWFDEDSNLTVLPVS